jgi:hypothetical protein
MSLNYQATRFTCSWPWSILVLLCDGRIVCGCADPYAKRVLGDARAECVGEIWTGPAITALRADLNRGGSQFCGACPLKLPLGDADQPPARALDAGPQPLRLYIECTAACNKRAVEMCEYIKARFSHVYLYTSTNGLAFDEEKARRLVRSGIDEVTFSIDGAAQASYARYRQRGKLDVALRNLRTMVDEKRRLGADVPVINWRYILLTWNDSDAEMNLARTIAEEIGVDRLTWETTDHPEQAFSRRFVPGGPDHERIRHEIWDDNNLGNAMMSRVSWVEAFGTEHCAPRDW